MTFTESAEWEQLREDYSASMAISMLFLNAAFKKDASRSKKLDAIRKFLIDAEYEKTETERDYTFGITK